MRFFFAMAAKRHTKVKLVFNVSKVPARRCSRSLATNLLGGPCISLRSKTRNKLCGVPNAACYQRSAEQKCWSDAVFDEGKERSKNNYSRLTAMSLVNALSIKKIVVGLLNLSSLSLGGCRNLFFFFSFLVEVFFILFFFSTSRKVPVCEIEAIRAAANEGE